MGRLEVKETTFYVVHSWMNTKLQLKSVERDMFAIIYGYSQDGESFYYGSLDYASRLTGYSKQAVIDALKSLTDKEFIIKEQVSSQKIRYKANLSKIETGTESVQVRNETSKGSLPVYNKTSTESVQNNKYSNIKNKIDKITKTFDDFSCSEGTYVPAEKVLETVSASNRHNTPNNPFVVLSDEERETMRNELSSFGPDAYLATLQAFNKCNKGLIDDGLNPYSPGLEGFRKYIERYGVSTKRLDQIKARI